MSGPEFFQTRMGVRFFEHTLPELVKQVSRLADAIEASAPKADKEGSNDEEK